MSHTRLFVVATILAGIILAGFAFSVPRTRDSIAPIALAPLPPIVPSVALRDVFKKGSHTITGSIEVPNPCTTVQAEASLVGSASSTQNILLALTIPEDQGVCLQEKSTVKFSTAIIAPARLPIVTTVNGSAATTTDL